VPKLLLSEPLSSFGKRDFINPERVATIWLFGFVWLLFFGFFYSAGEETQGPASAKHMLYH
jgi:hypothetical protein